MIAHENVWGKEIPEAFLQKLVEQANYDDNVRYIPGIGQRFTMPAAYVQHFDTPEGWHSGMVVLACGHTYRYRTGSDYFARGLLMNGGLSPFPCISCQGDAA